MSIKPKRDSVVVDQGEWLGFAYQLFEKELKEDVKNILFAVACMHIGVIHIKTCAVGYGVDSNTFKKPHYSVLNLAYLPDPREHYYQLVDVECRWLLPIIVVMTPREGGDGIKYDVRIFFQPPP